MGQGRLHDDGFCLCDDLLIGFKHDPLWWPEDALIIRLARLTSSNSSALASVICSVVNCCLVKAVFFASLLSKKAGSSDRIMIATNRPAVMAHVQIGLPWRA